MKIRGDYTDHLPVNGTLRKCLIVVLALLAVPARGGRPGRDPQLETLHQWKTLEYTFPSHAEREEAIANNRYVVGSGIPIDVAAVYNANGLERVFTTIPRFTEGIPYSLAVVSGPGPHTNGNPTIEAYPNYDWHKSHGKNCDGITSAFRVAITECNEMWVIDSGMIGGTQHCAPQLLLFSLRTNELIYRHRFEDDVYTKEASLFIFPLALVRDPPPHGTCSDTMVYVADVSYHGMVVHDYARKRSWRIENKFMYPDPDWGTHTVAGVSFTLMDGIFTLSSDRHNVFFHPLASASEYVVSRRILDNNTIWESSHDALPEEFRALGARQSECSAAAIDSVGIQYCVQLNPIKLLAWQVNTPYRGKHVREVPADARLLEFVSGMKVVRNSNGQEELWLLSNRFARLAAGVMDSNEVNYRILRRPLADIQGRMSQGGGGGGGGGGSGGSYGGSYAGGGGNRNADLHNKLYFFN